VFDFVKARFPRVLIPMIVLLLFSLRLAFRSGREMLLSIASLVVSGLLLFAVMGALGLWGGAIGGAVAAASHAIQNITGSAKLAQVVLKLDLFSYGWDWNLLNLMALPLLLGAGVDYSIHMQLALRRHGGDLGVLRKGVIRALLLCGGTTVAGFGSLAWSNNAGMASLGKVCATGIACCMFTAICLLPDWWKWLVGNREEIGVSNRNA
jgi:predicted RND superfamily exporter protein